MGIIHKIKSKPKLFWLTPWEQQKLFFWGWGGAGAGWVHCRQCSAIWCPVHTRSCQAGAYTQHLFALWAQVVGFDNSQRTEEAQSRLRRGFPIAGVMETAINGYGAINGFEWGKLGRAQEGGTVMQQSPLGTSFAHPLGHTSDPQCSSGAILPSATMLAIGIRATAEWGKSTVSRHLP